MNHEDEPVFKRSAWGTNRYYYNPDNPVGLAMIVITLVFVGTMLILMANHAGPFKPPAPAPTPTDTPTYDYGWPPAPSSPPTPSSTTAGQ